MKEFNIKSILYEMKQHVDFDGLPSHESRVINIFQRIQNGAFISYAQNYEDVILNRLFKSKKKGVYVDVGAYHPYDKSVTCLFSKRGWTGVNVDLCSENINRFEKHRPLDVNICAAVGSKAGVENFYVQKGTTRTTKDHSLGKSYKERGVDVEVESHAVVTLTELLKKNSILDVDFLSVDVEGSEADVFRGLDFTMIRPKVILAEATYPETDIPNWDEWEGILESANYECVYFDGLNRFYIEKNQEDIKSLFKLPPNYFDNFIRHENVIDVLSKYSKERY